MIETETIIDYPKFPKLADYQRRTLFSAVKNVVVEASTKSGKTVGCILWLLLMAWNFGRDGSEHWWIAPVYRQAKIAYRRLRRMLTRSDPSHVSWNFNNAELTITLANGAVIRFLSGDDPDNLFGDDVRDVVIDEATRCKEEVWYAVVSVMTATDGNCRVIGNVKGRRNWVYKLARRAESGEPGWAYGKFTAEDAIRAGFIKASRLEQAQRDLPEHVFRELYYAEPTEDGSNPFGIPHIAACLLPPGLPLPMGTEAAVCWGVDLAKSIDWTVVYGMNRAGEVVRMERWQKAPWDETIKRVANLIRNQPALVDETGVGAPVCDELRRAGCIVEGYTFTPASKQALMGRLAVAIQKHEVKFPDGVTRAELEAFEFEHTASGVRYSAPDGMHDDCVCALALAVWKWDQTTHGASTVEWADQKPNKRTVTFDYEHARKDPDWGFDS